MKQTLLAKEDTIERLTAELSLAKEALGEEKAEHAGKEAQCSQLLRVVKDMERNRANLTEALEASEQALEVLALEEETKASTPPPLPPAAGASPPPPSPPSEAAVPEEILSMIKHLDSQCRQYEKVIDGLQQQLLQRGKTNGKKDSAAPEWNGKVVNQAQSVQRTHRATRPLPQHREPLGRIDTNQTPGPARPGAVKAARPAARASGSVRGHGGGVY